MLKLINRIIAEYKEKMFWKRNSGRYTPIKLWESDSIGYHEGYYDCLHEHNEILLQHYDDCDNLGVDEANRLLDERAKLIERKYFGPKYIAADKTKIYKEGYKK